jgi:hypothetical protein
VRALDQVAAILFLLLGGFMVERAFVYKVFIEKIGTGPGFMPMLTGIGIMILAVLLFVETSRHQPRQLRPGFLPDGAAWRQIGGVIAALTGAIAGMNFLGFRVAIFLFVIVVMSLVGRHRLLVRLTVALCVSLTVHWAFVNKLTVPLPAGVLGF